MKYVFALAMGILLALTTLGCAAKADYSEIASKEWRLIEVKQDGKEVKIDRKTLESEGFENAFVVVFENDRISGVGTANRFFAPYETNANAIRISPIASTRAASVKEPKALKEREFFSLLQNARQCVINAGKLEILTKNGAGKKAELIFEGI
ncbi:MAG: META domain-containing protein [Helicobacteraceae bacterium]|nr:META domain-containing protein [Helicobacteraceae bacterium]